MLSQNYIGVGRPLRPPCNPTLAPPARDIDRHRLQRALPKGVAGSFSFELSPQPDGGIRITLTAAVGGYRPGGLDGFTAPVDRVLGEQLARLAQFVDKH